MNRKQLAIFATSAEFWLAMHVRSVMIALAHRKAGNNRDARFVAQFAREYLANYVDATP